MNAIAGPPQPQCCGSPSTSKKSTALPREIVIMPPAAPVKTTPAPISETASAVVPVAATKPAENTVELRGILCSANDVLGHSDVAALLLIVKNKGRADYYYIQKTEQGAGRFDEFAKGTARYATVVGFVSDADGKKFLKPSKVEISRR